MYPFLLTLMSWGAFFYVLNYIGVSYYIKDDGPWWLFSIYFVLLYFVESLFMLIVLYVRNGALKLPSDIGYVMLIAIPALYASSCVARYFLYDRKHLRKNG